MLGQLDRRTIIKSFGTAAMLLPSMRAFALAGEAAAPVWLEVDRSALRFNIERTIARLGGASRLCAVLKSDAYGNDIGLVLPEIRRHGVSTIGVATNREINALRTGGFDGRIVRVRTPTIEEIEDGHRHRVEELVGNAELGERASQFALRSGRPLDVHLDLDCGGMSRNGFALHDERARAAVLATARAPGLRVVGIMTHFPVETRDDVAGMLDRFHQASSWLIAAASLDRRTIRLHAANSYSACWVPESHLDMSRVGSALFGNGVPGTEFRRTLSFKTRIAAINAYPAGATVGYDRTATLKRNSLLANLPLGYADGFRRANSNVGHVLVRGQRAPVVGRVSMNTTMVDVTDIVDASAGDEVVLFGKQAGGEITQADVEAGSGTTFAELIGDWGARNPRIAV